VIWRPFAPGSPARGMLRNATGLATFLLSFSTPHSGTMGGGATGEEVGGLRAQEGWCTASRPSCCAGRFGGSFFASFLLRA